MNTLDTNGVDRLLDAAVAGAETAVGSLLSGDPDLTRRSIHTAAAVADVEGVFTLLQSDRALADTRDGRRQWTPLLYACCSRYGRGSPDIARARRHIARLLLGRGADPNGVGREPGYTDEQWRPLSGAIEAVADLDLTRTLLFFGAALQKTSAALTYAVRGGNVDVLRLLLELAPSNWYQIGWALEEAVVTNQKDMARLLVAHAAGSNSGSTALATRALMQAIRRERDAEFVELLLGDDTSAPSGARRGELYKQAVRHGHHAAAAAIERHGSTATLTAVDRVISACIAGNRPELQALLANASLKHAFRPADHRMLPWAIRHNRPDAVPLLLEAGLDPNIPDTDGETALHLASRLGSSTLVDQLVAAGADPDATNFDGEPALTGRPRQEEKVPDELFERAADAVAFGDLDTLRQLLDANPALVRTRSPWPHRCTLLNYCGANGTEDPRQRTPPNAPAIAQLLLERGADPNATCNLYGGGHTTMSLMLTSVFPVEAKLDGELARVLLRGGARLDSGDFMGAIEYGLSRAVAAFVEAGAPVDNLFVAAGLGRIDTIEEMLARGADIDEQFSDGGYGTALHAAASMNQRDAAVRLLERGAKTDLWNRWDATPANAARHFDHEEIAKLIEGSGGFSTDLGNSEPEVD